MATGLGRLSEVYIGTSSPATTKLTQITDPSESLDHKRADTTTNDSGGDEEHVVTHKSGSMSLKILWDPASPTCQSLITHHQSGDPIYIRHRPHGTSSGYIQHDFQATVVLKDSAPVGGVSTMDVTFTRTGAMTPSNQ